MISHVGGDFREKSIKHKDFASERRSERKGGRERETEREHA